MAKVKRRLTLVESTEPVEEIQKKLREQGNEGFEEFELWVRTPDNDKPEQVHYTSRLCSCRTVCIGFPPPEPIGE